MAEQTVRYRVELDDADLAQQLESIRNRLSEGVASYPNNLIQQQPLPTFDQSQIYTAPLAYTPVSMPEQGNFPTVNVPNMLFNMPENSSTGYQMATNNFARFRENASTGFEQVRVSSSEFVNNMNTGSEMAFNNVENFGVKSSSKGMSLWDSGAASFGIGYDASMPVFRSDYRDFYSQEFANNAKSTIASGIENTITFGVPIAAEIGAAYFGGAAAAAVVGGVGTLAALPVAVGLIGAETKMEAIEQTSDNLFNIAMYTPAKMSKVQAESIATSLYDYTKTDEANLKNLDIEDLNAVIAQFGAAGGFSKTTDVASFTQKTSQLIQNFREFMHALNMAQEDAAALMGELEAKGISSAANAPIFAAQMQVQASQAGMPTNDLISYGLQMGDMLKSEGFNPMQGFDFAVDARTEMNRLLNSNNPYYKNAIYQAGGVDAATNNLMKYLGSSSGGSDILYKFTDYSNTNGGKTDQDNVVVADGSDDYFKILEDGASMFSTDPLSVLKMLSTEKQVGATIGIKQRAQRNVSMAINALESFGYNRNELDPETVVGTMMRQAGGNLDAATAWQTYGLATSFTDYKGLSEQVNQILDSNQVNETDYSTWDVVENAFFGEKSLIGKVNNGLISMGVDFKKGMKSGAASVVNSYEDFIDAAMGRKRIHYEDIKDMNPEDFVFENLMSKLIKENRMINPATGNVFKDTTLRVETELDEMYTRDARLDNNEDNFNKINNAFNFKSMDPFLRRLGLENFTGPDNYMLPSERKTFEEYAKYANMIMTERDGSVRVAGSDVVLQNMAFSSYLKDEGFGAIENYKELGAGKDYTTFRESFLANLNDKTYAPMNFTNGVSSESYYDNLSIRRYGKSFDALGDAEQQNIHMFALDENGGLKYIKDSGIIQDYQMEMILPFTPAKNSNISRFSNDRMLEAVKDEAEVSVFSNLGLRSEREAINWLEAFNNPQKIGTTGYKEGIFDAAVSIISDKALQDSAFKMDIKALNEQFEAGDVDVTKLTTLYDTYVNKWFAGTPTADIWKTSTEEQKAAYIGSIGSRMSGFPGETDDRINSSVRVVDMASLSFVTGKLDATDSYRVDTQNMGKDATIAYIESLVKSGHKGKIRMGDYGNSVSIDGNTISAEAYAEISKNNKAFTLVVSGEAGKARAEADAKTAETMEKIGMGDYNPGTGEFTFNGNHQKYGNLYNSIFSKLSAGEDAVVANVVNSGLYASEENLQGLRSKDIAVIAKHAKAIGDMNETAMGFDLSTTYASKFKGEIDVYEGHIQRISQGLTDNWVKSYTASNSGVGPDAAKIAEAKKDFENKTRAATESASARSETIAYGMKTTNSILNDILYAVRNNKNSSPAVGLGLGFCKHNVLKSTCTQGCNQ